MAWFRKSLLVETAFEMRSSVSLLSQEMMLGGERLKGNADGKRRGSSIVDSGLVGLAANQYQTRHAAREDWVFIPLHRHRSRSHLPIVTEWRED